MDNYEKHILRALQLAQNGLGTVSPNPLVGCVIVYDDKIIGEGWHQKFGEPHAEVNAINSVKNKELLSKSTLYVTLEPCSHFGKTPPCADLIIKHKIPKVVVCNLDPFEKVNGSGVQKLKDAEIEVVINVLAEEGLQLNKRFFTSIQKKRPFVILKWAQTQDGFIARENFDSKWISNATSRKLVHKWRTEEDAILVGFNTALHDNPQLTARDWKGKNPIRIVLDKQLALPQTHFLFDNTVKTICFNSLKNEVTHQTEWVKIPCIDVEKEVLNALYKRNIQSLIVEGGSKTLQGFMDKELWDEARVFIGEKTFGSGIKAPIITASTCLSQKIDNNTLNIYKQFTID